MRSSRREFLGGAGQAAVAGLGAEVLGAGAFGRLRRFAGAGSAALTTVEVAYAGSMAALMEGPMAEAAKSIGIRLQGRAQGSTALAHLIAGGSLRPGVFLSITRSPMRIVQEAGLAWPEVAFATTSMAISYSPRSRVAGEFERLPWWQVLERPGVRFGRSDPRADPQGRNIIYVCDLAERYYRQPSLGARILGSDLNPAQIFSESTLPARVQSGQLDAAAAYAFQPRAYGLKQVDLPPAINLASLPPAAKVLHLQLDGESFRPEALVFVAAALRHGRQPEAARRLVEWLRGAEAQGVLRAAGYGPPPAEGSQGLHV